MAVFGRLTNYIKSKINRWLDKKEDPVELLNYANSQYRDKYREVKKSLIILKTNRKRLEIQESLVKKNIGDAVLKAKTALKLGKEELAEKYLKLKITYQEQMRSIEERIVVVRAQEEKLSDVSSKLKVKLDEYDTKRQVLEANYRASKAQAEIGEILVGIDSDSVKDNIELAENKIKDMESRSGAISEVVEETENSDPDRELNQMIDRDNLSKEMELLKKEIGVKKEEVEQNKKELGNGK